MKKITRITAAFVLILSMLITALPFSAPISAATLVYSKESNSGTRHVICTTLDGTSASSYYKGKYTYDSLDDLSASALFSALQTLMRDTHEELSTYDDCHYEANKTDSEQNNGKVTLIYTSYKATMEEWNGWNREHVWPKSLGGNSTKGGGADLHHIRPSDKGVNSSRGNKKYGNSDGGREKYGTAPAVGVIGGNYTSTYFEPLDNVKGDVARICLYMYVRWNSDWGCENVEKVFESVDVLLEWCELDPVDTWEMGRNEVIQEMQGNRNVFIDYPEYAWLIFGREVPASMKTPSGEASNAPPCTHASTEVKGAVAPTCGKNGYTGDTCCKDCGIVLTKGSEIPPTGEHTYGIWKPDGDKQTSSCAVCEAIGERPIPDCAHSSTEVSGTVEPTCGEAGFSGITVCVDCKTLVSEGSEVPPTGEHKNTVLQNQKDATCGEDGYSGDTYCNDCKSTVKTGETIPATGEHYLTEGEIISEPTKKQDGLRMDKCANCDHVEGVILPKTGSDNNNTATVIIIVVAVAVVIAAAVIVTVIVIKKKKAK